ncbi:MAG: ester cyclase [Thermoproteota archaeon]|jgi:predicted ester cyclase|nr:ester cyclase [Thermoproteota archaeon]
MQSNTLEENKILIKSFIEEVFNKHNLTAIDKYHATSLTNNSEKTVESFKKYLTAFFSGFPDLHVNIEHILAENNFVLVFLNFTGTHKGAFKGRQPTNKPVTIRSADLYRIENGIIVEHWDVVDQLDLLKQTGAISFNDTSIKQ